MTMYNKNICEVSSNSNWVHTNKVKEVKWQSSKAQGKYIQTQRQSQISINRYKDKVQIQRQ